nr:AMP-binding protein [Lachnospiraceae bacterium]
MKKRLIDYLMASAGGNKGITFAGEAKEIFVSYRELLETGYGISRKLYDCGVRQGDKVIIYCKDTVNFVYGYWSCLIGGYTAVPIDVKNEVDGIFFDSRFHENGYILTDFSDELEGKVRNVININDQMSRSEWTSESVAGSTDIIYIQYSSGTTSKTKGVMVRERNLIADVLGLIDRMQVTEDDVFLSWQPLTHCYGMITYHIVPLV